MKYRQRVPQMPLRAASVPSGDNGRAGVKDFGEVGPSDFWLTDTPLPRFESRPINSAARFADV